MDVVLSLWNRGYQLKNMFTYIHLAEVSRSNKQKSLPFHLWASWLVSTQDKQESFCARPIFWVYAPIILPMFVLWNSDQWGKFFPLEANIGRVRKKDKSTTINLNFDGMLDQISTQVESIISSVVTPDQLQSLDCLLDVVISLLNGNHSASSSGY